MSFPFGFIFGAEISRKQTQFPNEFVRFGRRRHRGFHFRLFRTGKFVEGVGGQFRIIKVHIHEARRGLKGMKSRAASA